MKALTSQSGNLLVWGDNKAFDVVEKLVKPGKVKKEEDSKDRTQRDWFCLDISSLREESPNEVIMPKKTLTLNAVGQ